MRTVNTAALISALFAALTTGMTAQAEDFTDYARVKRVEPEYQRVNTPQQECWNETVTTVRPRRDEHNVAGAIIGGVTGAVLGHQIGRGHGRDAATAVGAATGALIGDRWNHGRDDQDEYEDQDVRRCRTVDNWENRIRGYRVTYEYGGHRYTTLMPNDPGRDLRVRVSVSPQE